VSELLKFRQLQGNCAGLVSPFVFSSQFYLIIYSNLFISCCNRDICTVVYWARAVVVRYCTTIVHYVYCHKLVRRMYLKFCMFTFWNSLIFYHSPVWYRDNLRINIWRKLYFSDNTIHCTFPELQKSEAGRSRAEFDINFYVPVLLSPFMFSSQF
jgi:hypothetical protein